MRNLKLLTALVAVIFLSGSASADILITGVTADGSSAWDQSGGGQAAVDGTGLDALGQHSTDAATMYMSSSGVVQGLQIDLGAEYDITKIHIWNFNLIYDGGNFTGRGASDVEIYTCSDIGGAPGWWNAAYVSQGHFYPNQASGLPTETGQEFVLDTPWENVRYIQFAILNTHTTGGGWPGVSEIQFYTTPEPATLGLLAIGGTTILLRKKRNR